MGDRSYDRASLFRESPQTKARSAPGPSLCLAYFCGLAELRDEDWRGLFAPPSED
jgi:hypothetical protein